MMRNSWILALMIAWCVPLAHAGLLDGFGCGLEVLGGYPSSMDRTSAAAYNNPAGLGGQQRVSADLIYISSIKKLHIGDEPAGTDALHGWNANVSLPLGSKVGCGFAMYVPDGVMIESHIRLPEEPRLVLLNDRFTVLQMAFGAGYAVTDTLRLGVGVRMLAGLQMNVPVYIYVSNYSDPEHQDPKFRYSSIIGSAQVEAKYALSCGAQWQPTGRLSLSAVYRDRLSMPLDGASEVDVEIGGIYHLHIPMELAGHFFFEPRRVAMAAMYRMTDRLQGFAEASWNQWSAYHDPRLAAEIGPMQSNPPYFKDYPPADFRDVYQWQVGLTYAPADILAVTVGYRHEPSPAPDQDGATNLVDADQHVFAASGRLRMLLLSWLTKEPLTWDFFMQYHQLQQRTIEKTDPERDGEAYGIGGHFWLFGAGLSLLF